MCNERKERKTENEKEEEKKEVIKNTYTKTTSGKENKRGGNRTLEDNNVTSLHQINADRPGMGLFFSGMGRVCCFSPLPIRSLSKSTLSEQEKIGSASESKMLNYTTSLVPEEVPHAKGVLLLTGKVLRRDVRGELELLGLGTPGRRFSRRPR